MSNREIKKELQAVTESDNIQKMPIIFAVLLAINVGAYVVCTPLMNKVLELSECSIFSMLGMLGIAVLGTRIAARLKQRSHSWALASLFSIAGGVFCLLDALDIVYIPGPKVMATATGDSVFFILTYILSDVFSEVFGYKASRISNLTAAGFTLAVNMLGKLLTFIPAPDYAEANESAFSFIYGAGIYSSIAGIIIYAVGDWANDWLFRYFKSKNNQSDFGAYSTRSIGSSLLGKTADCALFSVLVMIPFSNDTICQFLGMESWGMSLSSIAGNFLLGVTMQITIEIFACPLSYLASKRLKQQLERTSA